MTESLNVPFRLEKSINGIPGLVPPVYGIQGKFATENQLQARPTLRHTDSYLPPVQRLLSVNQYDS